MYFEYAIERINKIDWNNLGNPASQNEKHLGYEYLKRMAHFFYSQNLKPINPLFTNIASLLGDKEIMNIMEYCNVEAQEALEDKSMMKASLTLYLQLAKYSDKNKNAGMFLQIYEPLIQLMEEGFVFAFREGGFQVFNTKFYPLYDWYERILTDESDDIL